MRRLVFFLAIAALAAGTAPLFAQLASDPNDRMYTDLKLWEDRGLVQNLPQLKPYPIQLLKKLLSDVQDKGNPDDAARARAYYADMDGVIHIHPGTGLEARTDFRNAYLQYTFLGGPFQGSLDPLVSYSTWFAGVANNAPGDALEPGPISRSPVDYISDPGVTSIGGVFPRVSLASAASIGSDRFWFQAGDIRGSWGPFWGDNAVLSPMAPQSGQFSVVYRGDNFTAMDSVMAISAVNDDGSGAPQPQKFLALHGLELYLLPWLTVGIFESVVWGPRFEPFYLLPYAVHFYSQGLISYPDNSFIGINGSLKLPQNVRVDFMAYFDDMSFNDIVRLNFNTRMKFAAQGGVSWTPNQPLLARLSFEALMITPYTYSHSDPSTGTLNYLDYSNAGQNMGPSLDPDSLRLELNALLRPDPAVDVKPFARLILRGNASAALPTGNGTIFDDGTQVTPPAYESFHFLDQSVIEKRFQLGADTSAFCTLPFGSLKLYATYTFEYILDAGLSAGAMAVNNYLTLGFFYQI